MIFSLPPAGPCTLRCLDQSFEVTVFDDSTITATSRQVGPLVANKTYYWRVDDVDSKQKVYKGDVWSFTMAPLEAYNPSPRDGDKWIAVDSDLTWQPGASATKYAIYFGTDKGAVAERYQSVFKGYVESPSFNLPRLQQNTTYYWLVDTWDSGGQSYPGTVWSFTTIGPGTTGIKGEYFNNMAITVNPALTRMDAAIDFQWGDNGPGTPIGTKNFSSRWTADLELAVGDTYTFVTNTDDGVRVWLNDQMIIDNWWDHIPTINTSPAIELNPGIYSLRVEFYKVAAAPWRSCSGRRQPCLGRSSPPVRFNPWSMPNR